jgi:cytoskeletal protein CcmA (bactofilin family)
MPDRRANLDPERLEPVLARGAEFSGLLVLHGAARIDGSVDGEIIGAEALCIGPGAVVEAALRAEEIVVAGEVRGDVFGARRVELRPGARVRGAVETPRLAVAEGSFLEGPCRAGSGEARETPRSP